VRDGVSGGETTQFSPGCESPWNGALPGRARVALGRAAAAVRGAQRKAATPCACPPRKQTPTRRAQLAALASPTAHGSVTSKYGASAEAAQRPRRWHPGAERRAPRSWLPAARARTLPFRFPPTADSCRQRSGPHTPVRRQRECGRSRRGRLPGGRERCAARAHAKARTLS